MTVFQLLEALNGYLPIIALALVLLLAAAAGRGRR